MLKRGNKIIALLVAATSVISTMPVVASEKNKIERLNESDGGIKSAVAFSGGKYLYEGSKLEADYGVYYYDGKKDVKLDSIDDLDKYTRYGDSSVIVTNGNDEEKINLADGTISDDGDRDDALVAARVKLKATLSKTKKYGSDTEIKSFTEVSNNKFGDDVWYAYTATGDPSRYDDILGVPKNLAAGLTFADENATAGKISGTVSITKAANEQDIDSYRVYYLDKNDERVGNAIGTVNKTDGTLKVAIADTNITAGVTQIGVYSVNSKGESETATKITIVDVGAAVKKYKAQVKIEITAFWANIVIEGKTFSPSWGSNLPDSLVQAVKNTKFDNYTVISAVSEHAFKDDGSVDNNNGKVTITLGSDEEVSSLPANFVTFNGDPNSGALNVKLISDYAVPDKLANGITFIDEDTAANKISGTVSITKPTDESNIDSYKVYYLNDSGKKVGGAIATVNKGTNPLQVEIADTDIPAGATQLGVYSVNAHGESVKSTKTSLIDTKNDPSIKSKIKIEATAFWSDIVIAGKTFSPSWGNNLPDSLANAVKNTTFDNYTVISAVSEHAFNADGSVDNNNGKVTITLGSNQKLSSLPTDFVSFNGDPNSSALNIKLISDYAVPDKLANGITFTDKDTAANKISGTVSITKAADESNIDSYRVYYLNDNGKKVGDVIGTVDKGTSPLQVKIADTDISTGITQLGVYSVNAHGESINYTKTSLIDAVPANTTTGAAVSIEAKAKVTLTITGFYGNISIAGVTFSPAWGQDIMSTLASQIQDKNDQFTGYALESAAEEGGAVVAVFTTTDSLLESNEAPAGFTTGLTNYSGGGATFKVEPITVDTIITANTTTSAAVNIDTGASATTSTTTNAAVSVNTSTNISTTTGAAVSVNVSAAGIVSTDNALQIITKNLTIGNYYAGTTSSEKVLYYGYADTKGNYIDCSKIANIRVFNGKTVVKFDKFNDKKVIDGVTTKLGMPTLNKTLGQDANYIYNLIEVPVIGYQALNSAPKNADASTTLCYVQKISKAKNTKDGGAYLPKDVESYYLSSDCGWDGGDNWAYTAAYYMLNDDKNDANRQIRIIDGNIYVANEKIYDTGEKYATFAKLKLKKSAKITPIDSDKYGKRANVIQPIVFEDFANDTKIGKDSNDTESGSFTMDSKGNAWAIYNGKITMSGQGYEWQDMYRCGGMNRLSVYDDTNLIAWKDGGDVYVTVKDGEIKENAVTKTGWQKAEDGSWHLYDLTGKDSKGWVNYSSCWYYFNEQGAMQTGWVDIEGKTYYLEASGVGAIGWDKVDGEWYYFDVTGVKQVNTTVDGYKLNSKGVMVQ